MLGGADTSLSRLINNLDKNRYEIDFITLKKNNLKLNKKSKVKIIKINSSRTIFSILKIRKILKKDKDKVFKKYIFLSNQNFANIISFFITIKLRWIKLCLIERNHLDEFKYNKNLKNFIIKLLIKILYKYADRVIGISKKLSLDLKKFTKSNVETIYNPAIDKGIYKLSKKNIFLKKNKKNILNVARLEKQKDHITLLRGFKESLKKNDSILIIIGYGSEKKKILKFIEENYLKKKVRILDKVSNPYPYYRKADLFVLTSLYEGFGNVLTEAAMFKIPIISTDCNAGPREILMNGKGGDLIKVYDFKGLSQKIISNLNFKDFEKIKIAKKNLKRFLLIKNVNSFEKIFKEI